MKYRIEIQTTTIITATTITTVHPLNIVYINIIIDISDSLCHHHCLGVATGAPNRWWVMMIAGGWMGNDGGLTEQ